LLLILRSQPPQVQQQKLPTAETIDASANYDWDADGRPDKFSLHVEKQRDYSIESGKQSKEKIWWYHCWLVVKSAKSGREIWQDEWSVKEDDMPSFKELADFSSEREYFQRWFTIRNTYEPNKVFNIFEPMKFTPEDVDNSVLAEEITRLKIPSVTPEQLSKSIVDNADSRSFCYRASWREDLRCAVYVPQLERALLYQNGYR
jgi:hypothetical protein